MGNQSTYFVLARHSLSWGRLRQPTCSGYKEKNQFHFWLGNINCVSKEVVATKMGFLAWLLFGDRSSRQDTQARWVKRTLFQPLDSRRPISRTRCWTPLAAPWSLGSRRSSATGGPGKSERGVEFLKMVWLMGIPGSCNVLRVWRPIPGQDAVAGGPEARGFVRQSVRLFQGGRRHKSVFLLFFFWGGVKQSFSFYTCSPRSC